MTENPTTSPLDLVLEAAREALRVRHTEAQDRVHRIRNAADVYLAALEHEIATDFASRNGLSAPTAAATAPNVLRAALDLRAAVEMLPELRIRLDASQADGGYTTTPTTGNLPTTPPRLPLQDDARAEFRARELRSPDPTPEMVALQREMHSMSFDTMSVPLFRAYAEEYAARARNLQPISADGEELASRVIRRLTAIAYEKGVADVYGLNRKHTGNWDEIAQRARARREALLAAPVKTVPKDSPSSPGRSDTAKLEVTKATSKATDTGRLAVTISEPPESLSPESEPATVQLPLLTAACERGPVVMVGGIVKQDKVQAIKERFGIDIEWIDTSRSGNNSVGSVEKRIREGRLAAVVVLQGLISHKHFEPLVGAARQVNLPFAYADKAGTGSVGRAFAEIERNLMRKDEAAS